MKISTKQYALGLCQAVKDKKEKEAAGAVGNFIKLLAANKDLAKADKISAEFIRVWNRQEGIVEAEVTSVRELDKETANNLNDYVGRLLKARRVIIKERVDGKILGGVIIRHEDKVFDASLRTRLEELKGEMVK